MAEEVARLVAVMETNMRGFTKGMEQAQRIADQKFGAIEKRMRQTESVFSSGFGKAGAVLAGFFSVRAITGFALGLSEVADKLDALSERTGISTDDLQKLGAVGRKANVDFGELSNGLDKFAKFVGQAATGQGDLAGVMKDAGIKSGQDYVATLLDIADAVKNAKTTSEEYRITTAALGKGSEDMVNFLRQGSDAIREQMDAFKSGISPQAVKDLAEFNKSWKEIEVSFQNMSAGPMAAVLKGFSAFLHDLDAGTWPEKLRALASFFTLGLVSPPAVGDMAKQLQTIARLESELLSLEVRRAAEQGGGKGPGLFGNMAKALDAEIAAKEAELNALKNEVLSHPVGTNRAAPVVKPFGGDNFDKAADAEAKTAKKIADDLISHYVELASKISTARLKAEKDYQDERQEVIDGADQREAEALQEFLDFRQELIDGAGQREAEALQEFRDKRLELIDEADQHEAERIGERQIEVADRLRSAFDITGAAGMRAFDNIGDAASQALQQIAAMAFQLGVMEPILKGLFGEKGTGLGGIVGGLLGSLGGGGGWGFPGSVNVTPGHFDGGGRPPVGRPSWVGERGRELFVPDVPGTIIPNAAARPGGHITITAPVHVYLAGANGDATIIEYARKGAIAGAAEAVRHIRAELPNMMADASARHF